MLQLVQTCAAVCLDKEREKQYVGYAIMVLTMYAVKWCSIYTLGTGKRNLVTSDVAIHSVRKKTAFTAAS